MLKALKIDEEDNNDFKELVRIYDVKDFLNWQI
jgi:hypothetical protein